MAPVVVVIPCYREPIGCVRKTVESALAVPIDGLRVVLVDDGASDESLDVLHDEYACLSEQAVTVLHLAHNGGPSAALNAGIESTSQGSVICRLDVRDEFYPEPKARQIETVLRGVRASASPHFNPVANKTHVPRADWRRTIFSDSCFTGVTNVYQRNVWEQVGIDTSLRWAEDWKFSMMIEHAIGWEIFPEVTCSAGEFPGGHTDCTDNHDKRARRDADVAKVIEFGRALSHPDAYAHLYNERWCAKRGIKPLPRRR